MAETDRALDDDFVYELQDMLAPKLREGKKRAHKHNQKLAQEKLVAIDAAIVAFEKSLVSEDATIEASTKKAAGATKAASNGSTGRDTFPS